MPRDRRQKSETGIYHIVMRGMNRSAIFYEEEDYHTFLGYLRKAKTEANFQLFAYCLMNNHIHLLMKEGDEELGIAFRRIGAGFVGWYNRKYTRCGHLFQDRFRSEPVESEQYLLTVIRYIHQNPVKAGIAKNVLDYPWSSIHEYCDCPKLCSTEEVLRFYGKIDQSQSFREFLLSQEYSTAVTEWEESMWTHERTLESFKALRTSLDYENREQMSEEERVEWMKLLIKMNAPIAKIAQLTEINRYFIEKWIAGIGKTTDD